MTRAHDSRLYTLVIQALDLDSKKQERFLRRLDADEKKLARQVRELVTEDRRSGVIPRDPKPSPTARHLVQRALSRQARSDAMRDSARTKFDRRLQ